VNSNSRVSSRRRAVLCKLASEFRGVRPTILFVSTGDSALTVIHCLSFQCVLEDAITRITIQKTRVDVVNHVSESIGDKIQIQIEGDVNRESL
jgi:hypothetical protein